MPRPLGVVDYFGMRDETRWRAVLGRPLRSRFLSGGLEAGGRRNLRVLVPFVVKEPGSPSVRLRSGQALRGNDRVGIRGGGG